MEIQRKVFTGELVKSDADKPIVAIVSTEQVDLAGDVIVQGANEAGMGWVLDDFNRRGRIYWMHDPMRPNLAKARARVENGRLLLDVEFDKKDQFASEIERKYRDGFLTEWSVGFRPVKYTENDHGGYTFFEQVLDEVSAVNQGMNPGTATVAKAYGDWADRAAEVKAILDGYEQRLREVEGAIMRASRTGDEAHMRAAHEAYMELKRARAAV